MCNHKGDFISFAQKKQTIYIEKSKKIVASSFDKTKRVNYNFVV